MRGLRPPPAPRITCNCGKTWAERMAAGTGSGDRVGETPPTAGDDSFESWRTRRAEERGRLVRNFRHQSLRLRERRKIRWKRAVRSAAGRRSSPRSSSCFLPDLCAGEYSRRAACDSEGEECLRSAERDGNVPVHTCALPAFAGSDPHDLDAPLPGAPKMSGETAVPPRAPMGTEPLCLSGGGGECTESRSWRAHGRFTQVRAAADA